VQSSTPISAPASSGASTEGSIRRHVRPRSPRRSHRPQRGIDAGVPPSRHDCRFRMNVRANGHASAIPKSKSPSAGCAGLNIEHWCFALDSPFAAAFPAFERYHGAGTRPHGRTSSPQRVELAERAEGARASITRSQCSAIPGQSERPRSVNPRRAGPPAQPITPPRACSAAACCGPDTSPPDPPARARSPRSPGH
jgi:hypothetical protein